MKSTTKIAIASVATALISATLTWLLPVPSAWQGTDGGFHWPLFNSTFYTFLYLGAAALFFIGLKSYKAKLRTAYYLIALSIAIVSVGVAQVAFLDAFNLFDSAWVTSGGVTLPFLLSGIAAYFGVRMLAILVGVRSSMTKLALIIPIVAGSIVLVFVLPHPFTDIPELFYDISNGIVAFDAVIYGICAAIVLKLKRHIGRHYTSSMAWLGLGLFTSSLVTALVLIDSLSSVVSTELLVDLLIVVNGFIYLKAGYAFAETREI